MMPDSDDSLDRDVTQAHSLRDPRSQADSLDRGKTAEERPSSASDISQFDEGWEQAEPSAELDTRYEIEGAIGHGGMGEVFRAVDNRLKRPVAIKRLKGDLSRNRRAVERFSREAEAVARLNHYNIVQIHDVGQDPDGHYIVMELVDGQSLSECLTENGPFELATAIELVSQICDALSYAHSQGIVHRDVKPANILVSSNGIPKLTDFGLARLESQDRGQTRAGAVLGTLDFMPPEQHRDARSADARSDQWALAATFYQMITGETPRVIRSERLPESVRAAVLQALEEKPSKRFEDCHAFRDALLAAQSAQSASEAPAPVLTAGECSQCRHVNDTAMTFCEACGTSLRVPCPACDEQIGAWATFCGKCGADVISELESKRAALLHQQKELDSLRRSYRHGEAIAQLQVMAELSHPSFADQKAWAERTLTQYNDELSQLETQRDEILQAATKRMNNHDVEGTLQLLERIPEPLSNPHIEALRKQGENRVQEIRSLGAEIRSAVESRQLDGLLPKVEQFLELRPQDEKALKLRGQLRKRELQSEKIETSQDLSVPAETPLKQEPFFPAELPSALAASVQPAPRARGRYRWRKRLAIIALAALIMIPIYLATVGDGVPSAAIDREPAEGLGNATAEFVELGETDPPAIATRTPATRAAATDAQSLMPVPTAGRESPIQDDTGWNPLFNGRDLSGWSVGYPAATKLRSPSRWFTDKTAGVIGSVGGDHDHLITDEEYENYTLELEWRFTPGYQPGANGSGVVLHSTGLIAGDSDPIGIEVDLRNVETAETMENRRKARVNGGLGMVGTGCFIAYRFNATNHSGKANGLMGSSNRRHLDWLQTPQLTSLFDWNRLSVVAVNERVLVRINGQLVNEAWNLDRNRGRICLRSQNAAIQFRNVRLKHHDSIAERDVLLLQGKWRAVGQEIDGDVWSAKKIADHNKTIQFSGDQFEIRYLGMDGTIQIESGSYRINPTWTPAFIDMTGTNRGRKQIEFNGIYQLNEGNLRHCFVKTHEDITRSRPNRFATLPDRGEFSTVYIREANSSPSSTTQPTSAASSPTSDPEFKEDWIELFNGRDLNGWTSAALDVWEVSDRMLVCTGEKTRHKISAGGANLYSTGVFENFVIRLQYKLESGGNGGVFLRVSPGIEDVLEIQLLDDRAAKFREASAMHRSGSIWGIAGAAKGLSRPAGEWNDLEIRADGAEITVTLNGAFAVQADLSDVSNQIRHPWKSGLIGLQNHTGRIEFRNIFIRELP